MKIGILDCGGANLNSIKFSLNRLGIDSIISNDACELERADKLIIPGVGASDIVMGINQMNNLATGPATVFMDRSINLDVAQGTDNGGKIRYRYRTLNQNVTVNP